MMKTVTSLLKTCGNYCNMYQLLQQSVTLHFLCMDLYNSQGKNGLLP
jgi:hypothetical protein